jgi:hypothetical protein
MTVYVDTPEGAASESDLAAKSCLRSMTRAMLMSQLSELSDKFNMSGYEDDAEIAHLLRCVWVAVHQMRTGELYNMISDTVDGWIQDAP